VQTQGLLQESSLASLLQTMQTERATGALALESESETASLFFLFGHLFHASGPTGQGEDVVLNALSWQDGSFHFDPRAKLPPEETIKSSPAELIAEAVRRAPEAAPPSAEEQEGWEEAGVYEETEAFPAPGYAEPAVEGYSEPVWTEPEPEASDQEATEYVPEAAPEPEPIAPAPSGRAPTRRQLAERRDAPAAYHPVPPAPARSTFPPPEPPPPMVTPPAEPAAVLGAPAAEPLDILYPLPSGQAQYEGLKSAFVDFSKLLRTLRADQHTGYVRLTAPDFAGVLLFQQGHLLDARSNAAGAQAGEAAFQALRRNMEVGVGGLDVIDLAGETVDALAQFLTGPLLYTGLLGRFVNFDALLDYLAEESVEGAVLVVGSEDIGIILFSRGQVLGAYTQSNPALSTSTTGVGAIAADKAARIEVKSGTGTVSSIDVESALSHAY
jgi:hypothetical protein